MTAPLLTALDGVLDADLLDHAEAVLMVALRQGRDARETAQAILESTLLAARHGQGPLARDQRERLVGFLLREGEEAHGGGGGRTQCAYARGGGRCMAPPVPGRIYCEPHEQVAGARA